MPIEKSEEMAVAGKKKMLNTANVRIVEFNL